MTLVQKSGVALALLLSQLILINGATAADEPGQWYFRGIDRVQFNSAGDSNVFPTPVLNRETMFADVEDKFDRTGMLDNTLADTHINQFITTKDRDVEPGPLPEAEAYFAGRWFSDTLVTSSKKVSTGAASRGYAYQHWSVGEGVGDDYLVEVSAMVESGDTALVGFLGDPEAGNYDSIDSALGELTASMTRIDGMNIEWAVSWNMDDGTRQTFSSILTTPNDTTGEDLKLQLGWKDTVNQDDLFNAWLETSTGNTELLSGNMATRIDVRSLGIELQGEESHISHFRVAVPEPSSFGLGMLGLLGVLSLRPRK